MNTNCRIAGLAVAAVYDRRTNSFPLATAAIDRRYN